jgi:hypothetical protein
LECNFKVLNLELSNQKQKLLTMFTANSNYRDFSKKVIASLSKKGISIIGSQAIPAFEGDVYFSGVAYILVWNQNQFIRTYSQVNCLALSSWKPESFFSNDAETN